MFGDEAIQVMSHRQDAKNNLAGKFTQAFI
jgi:hypothetical protein